MLSSAWGCSVDVYNMHDRKRFGNNRKITIICRLWCVADDLILSWRVCKANSKHAMPIPEITINRRSFEIQGPRSAVCCLCMISAAVITVTLTLWYNRCFSPSFFVAWAAKDCSLLWRLPIADSTHNIPTSQPRLAKQLLNSREPPH